MSFVTWKCRKLRHRLSARPIGLFRLVPAARIWQGRSRVAHGASVSPSGHQLGVSSFPAAGKPVGGSRLSRLPSSRALRERLRADHMVRNSLYVVLNPGLQAALGLAAGFVLMTAAGAVNLITDSVFIPGRKAGYNALVDGAIGGFTKVVSTVFLRGTAPAAYLARPPPALRRLSRACPSGSGRYAGGRPSGSPPSRAVATSAARTNPPSPEIRNRCWQMSEARPCQSDQPQRLNLDRTNC